MLDRTARRLARRLEHSLTLIVQTDLTRTAERIREVVDATLARTRKPAAP